MNFENGIIILLPLILGALVHKNPSFSYLRLHVSEA